MSRKIMCNMVNWHYTQSHHIQLITKFHSTCTLGPLTMRATSELAQQCTTKATCRVSNELHSILVQVHYWTTYVVGISHSMLMLSCVNKVSGINSVTALALYNVLCTHKHHPASYLAAWPAPALPEECRPHTMNIVKIHGRYIYDALVETIQ